MEKNQMNEHVMDLALGAVEKAKEAYEAELERIGNDAHEQLELVKEYMGVLAATITVMNTACLMQGMPAVGFNGGLMRGGQDNEKVHA